MLGSEGLGRVALSHISEGQVGLVVRGRYRDIMLKFY